MDGYHLAHLHSGTLAMYDHSKIECGNVGPHFVFWEPLAPHYMENIEQNTPYPLIDPSPKEKLGAYVPMLFPGIGLSELESTWSTFHIQPVAPDETIVDIRSKVAAQSTSAFEKQARRSASFWRNQIAPKYDGDPKTDPLATADFMEEDVFVCEQQQKSLKSPYFEHGRSSEIGEAPVREHQQIVLDYVEGRR
jgi:Rieske 2Fe-2S family protein